MSVDSRQLAGEEGRAVPQEGVLEGQSLSAISSIDPQVAFQIAFHRAEKCKERLMRLCF